MQIVIRAHTGCDLGTRNVFASKATCESECNQCKFYCTFLQIKGTSAVITKDDIVGVSSLPLFGGDFPPVETVQPVGIVGGAHIVPVRQVDDRAAHVRR